MAFIQGNPEDELQQQGQAPLVGQGSAQVSGGGVGGPANAGGSNGGWTNLQAYITANQGDSGSAQALGNTVNSQFDKERDQYKNDSSAFLQNAQDQVNKSSVSNEDADKTIKQAGSLYDYGTQNSEYTGTVDKMRHALTDQYSGPRDYTYGLSNQTQEYGDALKDNSGFDRLMGNVYASAAGRGLTPGQLALQKQLNVSNAPLAEKRKELAGGFEALTKDRDDTVRNTTSSLSNVEQSFREQQNKLRDYLEGRGNDYEKQIGDLEGSARSGYQNTYKTAGSGVGSIGMDFLNSWEGGPNPARQNREALGIYGGNLTWDQLQREQNAHHTGPFGNIYVGSDPVSWDQRAGMLNDFYGQQDAQYANTADEQERGFNTIQDFLNSGTKRKEQGFKVR